MSTDDGIDDGIYSVGSSRCRDGRGLQPDEKRIRQRRRPFGRWFRETGWRHIVGVLALLFALFPVWFVLIAAFSESASLSNQTLWPETITLRQFRALLDNYPFWRWFFNSLIISLVTSTATVLLAASAAFAFSRLRFRGRRRGLLALLLIQMFPASLAFVAIYLMVQRLAVFEGLGAGSMATIVLFYLGGALGANAWLIKGFFDTIPRSLDESAKIDGATHAQVYWMIIFPLAAPVLAIIFLLSFISTQAEFLDRLGDPLRPGHLLAVEDRGHRPAGSPRRGPLRPPLGPVRRRGVDRLDPRRAAVPVPAALHRRRDHRRRRQGVARGARLTELAAQPHHDGSPRYLDNPAPPLGERVGVRLRVPAGLAAEAVHVRAVTDGEPKYTTAEVVGAEPGDDGAIWWEGEVRAVNPVTTYRFLVETPEGVRWVNGAGTWRRDVGDRDDFVLSTSPLPPDWLADSVCYEIFPDRFARGIDEQEWVDPDGDWAIECDWDTPIAGDWKRAVRQLYRGDLVGARQRLDHLEQLGVNLIYLTPVFPARSCHRYDASTFDAVDPVLGGDAALSALVDAAHRRGMRVIGDLTTNHSGNHHHWFEAALADAAAPEAGYYYFTEHPHDYVGWFDVPTLPKFDLRSEQLREALIDGPDGVVARWLRGTATSGDDGFDGWRIDVGNMTGRHGDHRRQPRGVPARAGDDGGGAPGHLARR